MTLDILSNQTAGSNGETSEEGGDRGERLSFIIVITLLCYIDLCIIESNGSTAKEDSFDCQEDSDSGERIF